MSDLVAVAVSKGSLMAAYCGFGNLIVATNLETALFCCRIVKYA